MISGELDGAHMLAGQPIGATIGIGTQAHVITPFSMDLNGNGITVSNEIWEADEVERPGCWRNGKPRIRSRRRWASCPIVEEYKDLGRPAADGHGLSRLHPQLRAAVLAGAVRASSPGFYTPSDTTGTTDADVLISVTPPPQMPATLEQGTIQGYCVGEPWNQQAVFRGIGVPVVTNYEIWKNNPEKVFGSRLEFAEKHPNTTVACVKALIRAGKWLDASLANRKEAVKILAKPSTWAPTRRSSQQHDRAPSSSRRATGARCPTSTSSSATTRPIRSTATRSGSSRRCAAGDRSPSRSPTPGTTRREEGLPPGHLRRRRRAARRRGHLAADEIPETDGYKAPTSDFIDGVEYDGKKPNEYLSKFADRACRVPRSRYREAPRPSHRAREPAAGQSN